LLPKKFCLSKSKDIRQTIRNGEYRKRGSVVSLVARENQLNVSRIAIVVTREIGNAIIRNRIKRIFKAAFIEIYYNIKKNIDLVLFPTSKCLNFKSGEMAIELSKLLKL
jgi:ribonuclease P protein component